MCEKLTKQLNSRQHIQSMQHKIKLLPFDSVADFCSSSSSTLSVWLLLTVDGVGVTFSLLDTGVGHITPTSLKPFDFCLLELEDLSELLLFVSTDDEDPASDIDLALEVGRDCWLLLELI